MSNDAGHLTGRLAGDICHTGPDIPTRCIRISSDKYRKFWEVTSALIDCLDVERCGTRPENPCMPRCHGRMAVWLEWCADSPNRPA